jgi:hypothetical protein
MVYLMFIQVISSLGLNAQLDFIYIVPIEPVNDIVINRSCCRARQPLRGDDSLGHEHVGESID